MIDVPRAEIDVGVHSCGSTMTEIAVSKARKDTVHNITLYDSPGPDVQNVRKYNIGG